MAKNQLETNDSSFEPKSDAREDSGLQDLLSVAAKLKDTPSDEPTEAKGDESGVILFTAGDLGGDDQADEHEAMFGSFSGGLAAGFATPADLGVDVGSDPATSPDLMPLGGEGSVSEARPTEVRSKPEEPKRSPMTAIAVMLGLGLAALGIVYATNNDEEKKPKQQVAQAEMSANVEDAAVGKAELPAEDPAGASAGKVVEPEPEPEPEPELVEGETEGAILGEDAGALLAADTSDAADPMAQKAGLLEGGSKPVTKPGKWDQGTSNKSGDDKAAEPDVDPEPDPDPIVAPKPAPDPVPSKPAGGGGGNDDEVDCLLNPDLPKCNGGGGSKPKDTEVLAPKLPESLDQGLLKEGFAKAKAKAKACGSKFGAEAGTKVKVHVSIEGSTGKVTSVSAQGEHAGTDLGKCVEDAVKNASFSQFKKPSQGADYSMIL